VWIPGSRSPSTLSEVAKRGYCYFLSSRSHGGETHRAQQEFAAVLEKHGDHYQPFRFGILMSAYVAETDQQAREECEEGVWYFLKNCLKGHLRREGRQLTFGPGVPYIPAAAWREYLKTYKPGRKLLGDVENWDELEASQSIIVGSPDTVYARIWKIIEQAKVGNLLIQFHIGNMPKGLARKSMTLFAEEVAPRLRADSLKLFERQFPGFKIAQQTEAGQ
jgi:alkanesulfonate monooxygenase SsuD/methylene tetrahydromethanopterin reductase-like flavin-dependent oxidoreductase (luciferase family)